MLRVLPDKNKVVVEGINRVYRHLKPTRRNPQGGRLSKEMPIDVSNVMLIVRRRTSPRGSASASSPTASKERYCKKCGASLGRMGKTKAKA